jgi:hypothetical protein
LPPDQELGASESIYQEPQDVHAKGPAAVLLGTLGGVSSPLAHVPAKWTRFVDEEHAPHKESGAHSRSDLSRSGSISAECALGAPSSINYLAVRLKAGETWRYEPPADHTISWIALASGRVAVPQRAEAGELVAFEPSNQAIDFRAEADTELVLGSAASHPFELALGHYSVHTSPASLQAGEQRIAEMKVQLQKERRL